LPSLVGKTFAAPGPPDDDPRADPLSPRARRDPFYKDHRTLENASALIQKLVYKIYIVSKTSASITIAITMTLPWKRLIRFQATDGRILRGEPLVAADVDIGFITAADQVQARVLVGDDIYDTTGKTRLTDEVVGVKTVLGPFAQGDVPILRCVGLNYAKHSMFLQVYPIP
jgi:hypothetical protein